MGVVEAEGQCEMEGLPDVAGDAEGEAVALALPVGCEAEGERVTALLLLPLTLPRTAVAVVQGEWEGEMEGEALLLPPARLGVKLALTLPLTLLLQEAVKVEVPRALSQYVPLSVCVGVEVEVG